MKKIILLITILILNNNVMAQGGFYHPITAKEYDSLEKHSWYKGRVFLKNGNYEDGILHRNFETNLLYIKKDGKTKSYTGYQSRGFYLINNLDTAFFVYLDVNNNEYNTKWIGLRLLEDGKGKGISLFRYAWIREITEGSPFQIGLYRIEWEYYLWKDGKVRKLILYNRDLKNLIMDKDKSLKYYKNNKKKIKRNYSTLSNLIRIYNME